MPMLCQNTLITRQSQTHTREAFVGGVDNLVIIFVDLGVAIVVEVAVVELHRDLFDVSSALWVRIIGDSLLSERLCRL